MSERFNLKRLATQLLDNITLLPILAIFIITLTGGYKGAIWGIYVNITRYELLIYSILFLLMLRYIISRDAASAFPIRILVNIKTYLLQKPYRLLFLAITLYLVYFKILQHFNFYTYSNDLSVFDYPIHYTLQGRFMYFPWWDNIKNFMGMHFWPILIAIVPFYLILDSPITLLILQGVFTSLALVPLLKIAEDLGFDKEDHLYIGLFYIFNVYTWGAFIYDFHIEILYPLFIFSAFYTGFKKRYILHTIFILLTLSIKEDAFIHCLMLELYFLFSSKDKKFAVINIAISLLWGAVTIGVILPYLRYTKGSNYFLASRYGHLGKNYIEILYYVLSQPLDIIKMIFRESLLKFLFSFGFLPLFFLKLSIFGFPSLIIHLISNAPNQYNLLVYHTLPAMPFFIISTIYVLKRVSKKWRKRLLLVLAVVSLASFRSPGCLIPSPNDIKARNIFAEFSTEPILSVHSNIFPHLPRSEKTLLFPYSASDAKHILLKIDHWPGHINMNTLEYYQKILDLIDKENFIVEDYFYPYAILKKEKTAVVINKKAKEFRKDIVKQMDKRLRRRKGIKH